MDEGRLSELLGDIAGGDRAAASELYRLIGGRLYSIAQRVLRDPGTAEDAVQEAASRSGRTRTASMRPRAPASAWMAVIVRRVALDRRPNVARPELAA